MSIAVLIKNEEEMKEFVKMTGKSVLSKNGYPVVATVNEMGGQLQCMGLHEISETEFLKSAGYTLLSIVNDYN